MADYFRAHRNVITAGSGGSNAVELSQQQRREELERFDFTETEPATAFIVEYLEF